MSESHFLVSKYGSMSVVLSSRSGRMHFSKYPQEVSFLRENSSRYLIGSPFHEKSRLNN
jgi:hypothetical protein